MQLPNGDKAIVGISKLRDYCLSLEHPRGRHKARRFQAALGLSARHSRELREVLLRVAAESDAAVEGEADRFGRRYVLDFRYPHSAVWVRSAWIVRAGEQRPRLTTCHVL